MLQAAANVRYLNMVMPAGPSWAAWTDVEVYASGASDAADVQWLVSDQLGTPRMVVDSTGSLAGVKRHDYYAFGEEIPGDATWRTAARGYVGDTIRQKFTSYERDAEMGLDYAQARHYGYIRACCCFLRP